MNFDELFNSISTKFTQQTLTEIVSKGSNCNDLHINEIEIGNNLGKKGDSYLSTICRFTVKATGKNPSGANEDIFLHVLVKSIPKNIARRKTFRSADFFETEIYFYEKVWKEMKTFKNSKNIIEIDEIPQLLACFCDGTHDFIALEDLSYKGFRSIDRCAGIEKIHADLLLKRIANFHALSIACNIENPNFIHISSSLKETYFDEKFKKWYVGFLHNKMAICYRVAAKKILSNDYVKKVDDFFATDIYGRICALIKNATNSKLFVVTHGDTWIPNVLIQYDECGKPLQAVLIDFQLARYHSPVNDLIHFLCVCCSKDVLETDWDNLIEKYHYYLTERIYQFGFNRNLVSLDGIKKEIQLYSLIGALMSLESAIMTLLEPHEVADLDTIQGEEAVPLESVWDISPFPDDTRNKKLAFLIKHLIDKNLI